MRFKAWARSAKLMQAATALQLMPSCLSCACPDICYDATCKRHSALNLPRLLEAPPWGIGAHVRGTRQPVEGLHRLQEEVKDYFRRRKL